ncbi:Hypothetical predicted protein [Octopus vulgaris]|uniref:Uncharacterized protein n=1 Tax=Octopus vulgaris TaxID=6645 RepID=A0AA36AKQ6_OCTVU|nr:Hypothetical predicted protein [Octopus vulgaris]
MPGIAKLHLEDSLEGGPQTKSLLGLFEKDAMSLKKYSNNLHNCCQRILSAQELLLANISKLQDKSPEEIKPAKLSSDEKYLVFTEKAPSTASSVQPVTDIGPVDDSEA